APRGPRNAEPATAARLDAAVASVDAAALPALFVDDLKVDDHTTGTVYDREGVLFSLRTLMNAREPAYRHEALATLGDSLALLRMSISAAASVGRTFDVSPYEKEEIHLIEVDAQGRRRRAVGFAAGHPRGAPPPVGAR